MLTLLFSVVFFGDKENTKKCKCRREWMQLKLIMYVLLYMFMFQIKKCWLHNNKLKMQQRMKIEEGWFLEVTTRLYSYPSWEWRNIILFSPSSYRNFHLCEIDTHTRNRNWMNFLKIKSNPSCKTYQLATQIILKQPHGTIVNQKQSTHIFRGTLYVSCWIAMGKARKTKWWSRRRVS